MRETGSCRRYRSKSEQTGLSTATRTVNFPPMQLNRNASRQTPQVAAEAVLIGLLVAAAWINAALELFGR